MCFRTSHCCVDQCPAPMFGRPCKQELHYGQTPSCITSQFRVTQARIKIINDDLRIPTLFGTSCKFAGAEDFEQFGHIVPKIISQRIPLEMEAAYLSAMFAVSLSFRDLKMLGLLFSGKLVKEWTSEETILR